MNKIWDNRKGVLQAVINLFNLKNGMVCKWIYNMHNEVIHPKNAFAFELHFVISTKKLLKSMKKCKVSDRFE